MTRQQNDTSKPGHWAKLVALGQNVFWRRSTAHPCMIRRPPLKRSLLPVPAMGLHHETHEHV